MKIIKAEENNSEKVLTDKNIATIKIRNKGNSYGLGYKHTPEASIKMKQKAQARDNAHFRGRKHSELSKAKISQTLRLRRMKNSQ